MADDEKEKKTTKYPTGPIIPSKIVRRECPSGVVLELYPFEDKLLDIFFFKSGFVPDPRTHLPVVREMRVYEDDVLICAFGKAGTHWVWEISKMLLKGKAEYDPSPKEVAMLEFHSMDIFESMDRPRVLNSHGFINNIPNGFRQGVGKVIFVQRNPKDIAVSFYHHMINLRGGFSGTWEDFIYLTIKFGGFNADWYKYTLEFEDELKTNTKMKWHNMYFEDVKKEK